MILSQILSRILRSLRRPSKQPILLLFSAGFLVWILFLSSCTTTRTIPLEILRHDTIYINKEHYDSIYITRTSDTDRTSDTITITKTMTEYRYKYLRDTVRIVQRDSIPYEVRIVETKEVRKPPNLFDYICYISFGILTSILALKVFRMTKAL